MSQVEFPGDAVGDPGILSWGLPGAKQSDFLVPRSEIAM